MTGFPQIINAIIAGFVHVFVLSVDILWQVHDDVSVKKKVANYNIKFGKLNIKLLYLLMAQDSYTEK